MREDSERTSTQGTRRREVEKPTPGEFPDGRSTSGLVSKGTAGDRSEGTDPRNLGQVGSWETDPERRDSESKDHRLCPGPPVFVVETGTHGDDGGRDP